jgi:hypothetical protein
LFWKRKKCFWISLRIFSRQVSPAQWPPSTRSQSYERELQRQRCKYLQRHVQPSAFWKQKYYLLHTLKKHSVLGTTTQTLYVVVKSKVVGLGPERCIRDKKFRRRTTGCIRRKISLLFKISPKEIPQECCSARLPDGIFSNQKSQFG